MAREHPNLSEPRAVISLRDLRVSYGETEILHGIHFDVKAG
jgi:ABC-type transporter Mla maintaining outer membrane lipid asymmetry ATPase subunit MlaF